MEKVLLCISLTWNLRWRENLGISDDLKIPYWGVMLSQDSLNQEELRIYQLVSVSKFHKSCDLLEIKLLRLSVSSQFPEPQNCLPNTKKPSQQGRRYKALLLRVCPGKEHPTLFWKGCTLGFFQVFFTVFQALLTLRCLRHLLNHWQRLIFPPTVHSSQAVIHERKP